jgi:hypothetical protein
MQALRISYEPNAIRELPPIHSERVTRKAMKLCTLLEEFASWWNDDVGLRVNKDHNEPPILSYIVTTKGHGLVAICRNAAHQFYLPTVFDQGNIQGYRFVSNR